LYFANQAQVAKDATTNQNQSQTATATDNYASLPQDNGTSAGGGGGTSQSTGAAATNSGKSATARATKTAVVAKATATPGELDWTRQKNNTDKQISNIVEKNAEEITKKGICESMDISDSWSSPIDKIVCNMILFTDKQILVPFDNFACLIQGSNLRSNFADTIDVEYKNGQCLVIDR
jgi:hypothetical protein